MISIIIPAYNCEAYIENTIDSICDQSYQDFEIIAVNDGSTDNTCSILTSISEKINKLNVYSISNKGSYGARMFGVTKATGEWIVFVDADDALPRNALELLMSCNDGSADIVVGTIMLNKKKIFQHKICGSLDSREYIDAILLRKTSIGSYAKLYRRSIFENIPIEFGHKISQNEDMLMLMFLANEAKKIIVKDDMIVYNYIRRNEGQSHRKLPLSDWFILFEIIDNFIEKLPYKDTIRASLATYKINTLYEQGVLKLNDFSMVEDKIIALKDEISGLPLDSTSIRKLQVILSPTRRFIYGNSRIFKDKVYSGLKKLLRKDE